MINEILKVIASYRTSDGINVSRNSDTAGNSLTIYDTSTTPKFTKCSIIHPTTNAVLSTINEGDQFRVQVEGDNLVTFGAANPTIDLVWSGTASNADFSTARPTKLLMQRVSTANTNKYVGTTGVMTAIKDRLTEGVEWARVKASTVAPNGVSISLESNQLNINDISKKPTLVAEWEGGVTSVNEGSSVTLVIKPSNFDVNTNYVVSMWQTGGINDADFTGLSSEAISSNLSRMFSGTIISSGGDKPNAVLKHTLNIAADRLTEGDERFELEVITTSGVLANISAETPTMTIKDTSKTSAYSITRVTGNNSTTVADRWVDEIGENDYWYMATINNPIPSTAYTVGIRHQTTNAADFIDSATKSFTTPANPPSVFRFWAKFKPKADNLNEGDEIFHVELKQGATLRASVENTLVDNSFKAITSAAWSATQVNETAPSNTIILNVGMDRFTSNIHNWFEIDLKGTNITVDDFNSIQYTQTIANSSRVVYAKPKPITGGVRFRIWPSQSTTELGAVPRVSGTLQLTLTVNADNLSEGAESFATTFKHVVSIGIRSPDYDTPQDYEPNMLFASVKETITVPVTNSVVTINDTSVVSNLTMDFGTIPSDITAKNDRGETLKVFRSPDIRRWVEDQVAANPSIHLPLGKLTIHVPGNVLIIANSRNLYGTLPDSYAYVPPRTSTVGYRSLSKDVALDLTGLGVVAMVVDIMNLGAIMGEGGHVSTMSDPIRNGTHAIDARNLLNLSITNLGVIAGGGAAGVSSGYSLPGNETGENLYGGGGGAPYGVGYAYTIGGGYVHQIHGSFTYGGGKNITKWVMPGADYGLGENAQGNIGSPGRSLRTNTPVEFVNVGVIRPPRTYN